MSQHLPPPSFEKKIVPFEELEEFVSKLPHPIVLTNGVFDILHRGHVTYLAQAASLGASLVVAVNSDESVRMLGKGPDRPINSENDRAAVLAALESTACVVIFKDKVPLEVVKKVRPDIYVKGGDYEISQLPEAEIVHSYGGKVVTVAFDYDRSTTKLLNKVRSVAFFTGVVNGCVQEALFGAAVKALSVVLAGDRFAFRNFTGDRIGQLDFSSGAAVDLAKTVKDFRFKNIASDHCHGRGCNLRIRFFNNRADCRTLLVFAVNFDNAVLFGQFTRNGLYSKYVAAVILFTRLDQLGNRRLFGINQVISQ